jgi:KDO2-lipid IV(A) lauroyltransferase
VAERHIGEGTQVLIYYLYRLAGWLLPLVPGRFGYWLAERIGDLLYRRNGLAVHNVRSNMRHVFGPGADQVVIERTVQQVFRNQVKNYFDVVRVPRMSDAEIQRRLTIDGLDRAIEALRVGKGLILVSAHFGNFDVVGQIAAILGYRVTAVTERLKPERLYCYVTGLRAGRGLELIPADGSLKPIFKALRRGDMVGLAADRDITNSGLRVDFFGAPAQLPDGHVRLAMRTGAPIIMAFGRRLPDNNYAAYVEPPLWLSRNDDVQAGMRQVVATLEHYIRRYPDQWVMFQPVWRDEVVRAGTGKVVA